MRGFVAALVVVVAAGCGPSERDPNTPAEGQARLKNGPAVAAPESTKVSAFSVDNENLNVDRISVRDGGIHPDGNRDLVFRATVEGPADAIYLVTTSQKGEPQYGFRADTIAGHEELPHELGSVVDVGRLTVWIAVQEEGRFINRDGGGLGYLAPGAHSLKLYVPNPGNLTAGTYLRLYARAPNGGLVAGPIVAY